jgi:SAM-dependent methyltransferase
MPSVVYPVYPACPVCATAQQQTFLARVCLRAEGQTADLVECQGCASAYFATMPGLPDLEAFYGGDNVNEFSIKDQERGMQFARILRRIKPEGRILDIGCHRGDLLYGVKQHCQWEVIGTELNRKDAEYVTATRGFEVRWGELQDIGFPPGHFDVVHIQDVLEHVRDPATLLAECRRILSPTGVILLAVPNGPADRNEMILYFNRTAKPALSPNGHLYFFSRGGIQSLLGRSGLDITRVVSLDFKSGLRRLGWWPRKANWLGSYDPNQVRRSRSVATPPHAMPTARRSRFSTEFRFLRDRLRRRQGWYDIALNFELTITAAASDAERS